MKKLIIQIPCYNEELALPVTLKGLPRSVPGVDKVEWLIINDGSTDKTVEVALAGGVDHIVSFAYNRGLARAFQAGLEAALKAGADIIVNIDADNQYRAEDIPLLIEPLLDGGCEMVIGSRPIDDIEHFSGVKRALQKLGSWVVRVVSGTDVPDAPSGFRAISRNAALHLNVFDDYTYTLETIIQAGIRGIPVKTVSIGTNADIRPSRLVRSMLSYVFRSMRTIFRIFMAYKPLKFFLILGSIPFSIGFLIGVRWLILYMGKLPTHVPSLILAALLMYIGVQLWILGLVADLLSVNRKLLEEIQFRIRRFESNGSSTGSETILESAEDRG